MIKPAQRLKDIKEYYFSTKLREIRELNKRGKNIINMGIGNPDLSPPENVINALKKATKDNGSHKYQPYKGINQLRMGISDFYKKNYNISLDSDENILPLIGSKEGIMHISLAFLNKGDKVLIPNPGYPSYQSITKLVGAEPLFYPLLEKNNWLPDLDSLKLLVSDNVKLMWINYPNMPTGKNSNIEFFKKIYDFAVSNDILVINDNPYSFILNDNPVSFLSVDSSFDHCLELNSLSKSHNMAGWRVGMVVGSKNNIDTILKVKSNVDSGMYYGIQKGAIEALCLNSSWYKSLNKIYRERREIVFKICDKLVLTYDKNSTGMFVWAKINSLDTNSIEFVDNLLYNKEIFITPGSIFGTNGEGYVRLSLCLSKDKLNEALNKLL
tara:strand:+ start:3708 stop:4856 length:1149 start_codon:yes stop_codon:yes gene_type:complete